LNDTQSSGLPAIPGTYRVSKAPNIHVGASPSLANRLRTAGKWLNCKNAVFKSRMTDDELIKRGLTRQQMLQAYTELGCP
jgi:hypothetical protein